MAEVKTKVNKASPEEFIRTIPNKVRQQDALVLLKLFKKATGLKPKMWGTSIIGYGMYHFKSERSSQQGDWPLVAFSPRKQSLTLYIMTETGATSPLFKKLGKHTTSKACLYINKLTDVDLKVLEQLIKKSFLESKKKYNSK